jgi:hypothetical protein
VVTDRGGGRREEEVDSGEERYRAGGGGEEMEEATLLDGVVGEVGEAGPGKGEEWRREVVADPGFALRNRSTS